MFARLNDYITVNIHIYVLLEWLRAYFALMRLHMSMDEK